ncbi:hypothetical protein [Marinobacterium aestuariivivens]|uniref:Transposase n=1 Tax=Marinobacterium aestuariivivens TaxID=1698799 RepID=A0ABW1ZY20_9GAMM
MGASPFPRQQPLYGQAHELFFDIEFLLDLPQGVILFLCRLLGLC